MSWMQKLCEAYDAGVVCDQSKEAVKLVPLGFVRKRVKYHVVLSREGRFVSADELMDESQFLEIPSTPQAESRTGDNGAPFPLVEQLKYLIFENENSKRFSQYMGQLNAWCERPDAPACLRVVYTYLEGHTLLTDLESQPNLKLKYYKNVERREGTGEDTKAMVCFSVQTQDESADDLWLRTDVKQSWERYLADKLPGARALCYVEGKILPAMENHPKLQGNAKLISAKDNEFPFQYKGRFAEDRSAAVVSYEASVRAHNALIWLIARQGMQKYGMTWVVWNTNGAVMKVPIDEKNGFMEAEEEEEEDSGPVIDTFEGYAKKVRAAAGGYDSRLHGYNPHRTNCAVILGLEAATDGRMSVTYYQECSGNEYVKRLEAWYKDCCWWSYSRKSKTKEIASPNPEQIAVAVMGIDAVNTAKKDKKCEKSHTKLMRGLHSRILACIADEQPFPIDVVRGAFNRVSAPLTFVSGKDRQWSRTAWENSVDTACAMISCFQTRGQREDCLVFTPMLEVDSKNGDYLYGRLLAAADFMEEKSTDKGRDYPTNAVRLMQKFVQCPFETWPKIHEKLIPCFKNLGPDSKWYQILFGEIEKRFPEENRYGRRELSLEFLLGFSSQRQMLYQKWKPEKKIETGETVIYALPRRRSELYGCLLAVADVAEQEASEGERAGMTNAIQMMSVFAAKPYESWGRLHDKLLPYLIKLGKRAEYYQRLIGFTEMQFSQAERVSTEPLDGSYLHGYYCMRQTFYQKTQFSRLPQTWETAEDSRSVRYGRLLGIADRMEKNRFACEEGDIDRRSTNELRFMTVFSRKPSSTWENLKVKLKPYQRYGGNRSGENWAALEQLEQQLKQCGWNTDIPLGSIYLHGYYEEKNK